MPKYLNCPLVEASIQYALQGRAGEVSEADDAILKKHIARCPVCDTATDAALKVVNRLVENETGQEHTELNVFQLGAALSRIS